MEHALRHFLDALERRRRVIRGIDLYWELLFISSVTAAIGLLVWRLVPMAGLARFPVPPRAVGLGLIGGVVLAPMAWALLWARRQPGGRAAAEADRALGLQERLLTASEVLGRSGHPLAELLLGDVAPRLEGRHPDRIYPLPAIGYRAGFLLALLALGVVAMAPPELTWEQVRKNPLSVVGLGGGEGPAAAAPTAAPRLTLVGMPREGQAPLSVYFLGYADRAVESWEWDFGDGTVVRGDRQQEHVYVQPGTYTVTLRAAGGERIEKDYIVVKGPDGGGGGSPPPPAQLPPFNPPKSTGPQSSNPTERPPVETLPHGVTPLDDGKADLVEKDKSVFSPGPGGASTPPPPFEKVYSDYRRVAEEAIGRDRIPGPLADYVRAYFDRIRPR